MLLLGCDATLSGEVRGSDGAPVEGAVLLAPGADRDCRAVTGSNGRFNVRCGGPALFGDTAESWAFAVHHPDYIDRDWSVPRARGEVDAGSLELERIPLADGLHLYDGAHFVALPPAAFARVTDGAGPQRWCVGEGAPIEAAAGRVRLLDNHVADWKVFRVDVESCAYRMQRGMGPNWSYTADEVAVAETAPISEGRAWVTLDLAPGDYVIADWYAGFFVREAVDGDRWRASWLRVR